MKEKGSEIILSCGKTVKKNRKVERIPPLKNTDKIKISIKHVLK
jgi:hypothetical protein